MLLMPWKLQMEVVQRSQIEVVQRSKIGGVWRSKIEVVQRSKIGGVWRSKGYLYEIGHQYCLVGQVQPHPYQGLSLLLTQHVNTVASVSTEN